MANRTYWRIFIDEVLADMGIILNEVQCEEMLEAIIGHAEMERESTGLCVADSNLIGYKDRELKKAQSALKYEQEKITCRSCNGKGFTRTSLGVWVSTGQCYECNGEGRVHPSKASRETLAL